MNHKQKYFYTALGAVIMLIGIGIGTIVSPITAQSNGTFGEIQCAGLTVVDKEGRTLIELKNDVVGGAINLYNLSGQEMMKLKVNHAQSLVRLYSKSAGSQLFDNSETPKLGIHLDASPFSNFLEVGNTVRRGGIRLHNSEAFSELQVYHRNGQGGTVLFSSEDIHSVSVYDQGGKRAAMRVNRHGNGAVSTWDKNGYRLD